MKVSSMMKMSILCPTFQPSGTLVLVLPERAGSPLPKKHGECCSMHYTNRFETGTGYGCFENRAGRGRIIMVVKRQMDVELQSHTENRKPFRNRCLPCRLAGVEHHLSGSRSPRSTPTPANPMKLTQRTSRPPTMQPFLLSPASVAFPHNR